jgi:hypothetical protein
MVLHENNIKYASTRLISRNIYLKILSMFIICNAGSHKVRSAGRVWSVDICVLRL